MRVWRLLWASYVAAVRIIRVTRVNRLPLGRGRTVGEAVDSVVRRFTGRRLYGHSVRVHGQMIEVGNSDTIEMLLGDYEPGTTRVFLGLLRPGMTVVDVGANIGYYTLLAAGAVGQAGMVFAFEPSSSNFALLQRNVAMNGCQNVILVNKALGARSGVAELHLGASQQHSLFRDSVRHSGSERVEVTSLDDFMGGLGWPVVDVIKIDVEGAEPAVIDGMRMALERCHTRHLIVEFCPFNLRIARTEPDALLKTLESLGFRILVIDEARGVQSSQFDDLLRRLRWRYDHVNLFCER